jgi:hypothetical protein
VETADISKRRIQGSSRAVRSPRDGRSTSSARRDNSLRASSRRETGCSYVSSGGSSFVDGRGLFLGFRDFGSIPK